MGIFSTAYLESAYGTVQFNRPVITEADQLRIVQNEALQMFDDLYQLCEDAEDMLDENDVLQENFIDDFKDSFKSIITLITKGREAMLDQSQKAAAECEEYIKELNALLKNDKEAKAKVYENIEQYNITVTNGSMAYSYTEYRKALYSKKIFDLDDIKKRADGNDIKELKKIDKKYKTWVFEVCRFSPVIIANKTESMTIGKLAQMLKDIQSENKEFSVDYRKCTNDMIANINKGMSMIKADTNKLTIKWLKKYVNYQKLLYKHDTNLLNSHNMMILRQSRYIKKFVNKHAN